MSAPVMSAGAFVPLPSRDVAGMHDGSDDAAMSGKAGMASAFATVGAPGSGDGTASAALAPEDMLSLISVWLPPTPASWRKSDIGAADIVVPQEIAGDGPRRRSFKLGVLSARGLGLEPAGLGMEDLMALGRQTAADHVMAGGADDVLVALARAEGWVDEAAWAAGDKTKVAGQVNAFVQSVFRDEIELCGALEGLSAEPPLLGRRELADALLREHGIDTEAMLGGYEVNLEALKQGDLDYMRSSIAGSSAPLIRQWKTGELYFNSDRPTADLLRRMKLRGGASLSEERIARLLRELPASLDAEFNRRFDAHQRRMSTLLSSWIAARLSLHAKENAIDLAGATVTVSRAKMRIASPAVALRTQYSEAYGVRPSAGFLVAIRNPDGMHRCFISSRTGAAHSLPPGDSVESWLRKEHELVFEDTEAYAQALEKKRAWRFVPSVEEAASGSYDVIRERISALFHDEIERGREDARGMNASEGVVDGLLNLIPFRAMVVALRKGDIATAAVMGGMDVLSLLPLVGAGVRLGGAAVRSATPWLSMGMRFGGAAGRQGLKSLHRMGGGIPYARLKAGLAESAIRGWARLRPLDVQRVAAALRATSPKLATLLGGVATRTRGATIPDGVWRVDGRAAAMAAAERADEIGEISPVIARSLEGGELRLLPYGDRAGVYTQIDAKGQRIGAVLVADSGGWLYQTMPLASLERYRVRSSDIASALVGRRAGADGTLALLGRHYARLGSDYVEVTRDLAVSTPGRPIWRAVAPEGMAPDVIAHRLVYEVDEGLWRQAVPVDVPGLAGGGQIGAKLAGWARTAIGAVQDMSLVPAGERLASYRAVLVAGMRGATPEQAEIFQALLDRIGADRRGMAILRAMSCYHELHGEAPDIVLRTGADAADLRPSLDRPVRGKAWHLDLQSLRFGTTDSAIQELAAVYNNMTGLLQNEDPFEALLARGGPPLDPKLEERWTDWVLENDDFESRALAINRLEQQLREMRCYGGLDRSTFKSLLRDRHGRWNVRINLSFQGLTSIPPLPDETETLIVSHNTIRNWKNLPEGLRVLHAEHTHMLTLPALPARLEELNLSNNFLRDAPLALPSGLKRLEIARNGLTAVPRLPASLEELIVYENNIRELPEALPSGIWLIDASKNALARLPTDLPRELKILYVGNNRLTYVPAFSRAGLEQLDVSSNSLESLPPLPDTLLVLDASGNALSALPERLPQALRVLRLRQNGLTRLPDLSHGVLEAIDVSSNGLQTLPALPDTMQIIAAHDNLLSELPGKLPRGLKTMGAARNRLRRLPEDLPSGLGFLSVSGNAIEELPAGIVMLESCEVHLDGNPIPMDRIPVVAPDRAGPQFFLMVLDHGDGPGQAVRPLAQAVRYWWTHSIDGQARWDAIAMRLGTGREAMEFSLFLDRLRRTVCYQDEAFRLQVESWLVELAKPERERLLQQSLRACLDSTGSCNDRIITTWNALQVLRRNDDIEHGIYDGLDNEVVEVAREMFRIDALADIARDKESELAELRQPGEPEVDSIEVYLAYAVRLRGSLGLTTIAPQMHYYRLSGVTEEELAEARKTVLARESREFDEFLVLDYEPWQTFLKRKDAQAYADAEAAAHQALEERFEPELRKALEEMALDASNTGALDDARRTLGPAIMREIRYRAMAPLSRRHLGGAPREAP